MRGTEKNPQARLWPHQPHSSKVLCVVHVPFSVSASCRKVCLTGVIPTACRNLAAVLGKTTELFYPQNKTAFTGDWHFAEVSLVPRAWCRGCPALAMLPLRLWALWKSCSGFFPEDLSNVSQPWYGFEKELQPLLFFFIFFVKPFLCAATN